VIRGTAADLAQDPRMATLKGEVVMLVDRPRAVVADDDTVRRALQARLGTMTVKDAARDVAAELGMARRDVYQIALGLDEDGD
jgi:16S rRNA (cytidine1402-2'-O)-methyltransferase